MIVIYGTESGIGSMHKKNTDLVHLDSEFVPAIFIPIQIF